MERDKEGRMMKRREPETHAVLEAKAELGKIVRDLRTLKGRVLAVVRGLRSAAATAPVVATVTDGEKLTAEDWLADVLEEDVRTELGEVIRLFATQAREDPRAQIREHVRDEMRWEARHSAKDQGQVRTEPPTVADANRAAVLAAMQREGAGVHQVVGRTVATVKIVL